MEIDKVDLLIWLFITWLSGMLIWILICSMTSLSTPNISISRIEIPPSYLNYMELYTGTQELRTYRIGKTTQSKLFLPFEIKEIQKMCDAIK